MNLQVLSNFPKRYLSSKGPLLYKVQDHLKGEQVVVFTSMFCPQNAGEAPHRHTIMATHTLCSLSMCGHDYVSIWYFTFTLGLSVFGQLVFLVPRFGHLYTAYSLCPGSEASTCSPTPLCPCCSHTQCL